MFLNVGRNRIRVKDIKWYRMYNESDDRIIGVKGNMHFCTYPKDDLEEFDPRRIDEEYIQKYTFTPISETFPKVEWDVKKIKFRIISKKLQS